MNKYGRKVLQALAIGGTIAAGVALNSNNAMAAELEEATVESEEVLDSEAEPVLGEQVTIEGTQTESEEDESIQKMEDAVEVIEGDAVAEQGYLEKAEEAIEKSKLTEETAEKLLSGGKAVLEQAQEKNETVNELHNEIVAEAESAEKEFVTEAKKRRYFSDVRGIENAASTEAKLEKADKAKASEDARYQKNCDENAKDYQRLLDSLEPAKQAVADAEADALKEEEHYAYVQENYEELQKEYAEAYDMTWNYMNAVQDLEDEVEFLYGSGIGWGREASLYSTNMYVSDIEYYSKEIQKSEQLQAEYLSKLEEKEDEAIRKKYDAEVEKANVYKQEKANLEAALPGVQERYDECMKKCNEFLDRYDAAVIELEELKSESAKYFAEHPCDIYCPDVLDAAETKMYNAQGVWSTAKTKLDNIQTGIDNFDSKVKATEDTHNNFYALYDSYKKALENKDLSTALVERSASALAQIETSYNALVDVLDVEIVETPTEVNPDDSYTDQSIEENLQKMKDAVSIIEDNATAEEVLVNQASEIVANNEMTLKTVEDEATQGLATCEDSIWKSEVVKAEYENFVKANETAKNDFYEQLRSNGLSEYVDKLEVATDTQEKLAIITEVRSKLKTPGASSSDNPLAQNEEYKALMEEIDTITKTIIEAEAELADAEEVYGILTDYKEYDRRCELYRTINNNYMETEHELFDAIVVRAYRFTYWAAEEERMSSQQYAEKIAEIQKQIEESERCQSEYLSKLAQKEDESLRGEYNKEVENYNALIDTLEEYKSTKEKLDEEIAAVDAEVDRQYEEYLTYEPKLKALKEEKVAWEKDVKYYLYDYVDEFQLMAYTEEFKDKIETAKVTINAEKEKLTIAQNKKTALILLSSNTVNGSAYNYSTALRTLDAAETLKTRADAELEKASDKFRELNLILGDQAISLVKDATALVESDVVVENNCLNNAKSAAELGVLNESVAEAFVNLGQTIVQQAQNSYDDIQSLYEKMALQVNGSERSFVENAVAFGLSNYADEFMNAKDVQSKLNLLNVAISEVDADFAGKENQDAYSNFDSAATLYKMCLGNTMKIQGDMVIADISLRDVNKAFNELKKVIS